MDKQEIEIRRILEAVANAGTYEAVHIQWLMNLMEEKKVALQEELKSLLNVRECDHEF